MRLRYNLIGWLALRRLLAASFVEISQAAGGGKRTVIDDLDRAHSSDGLPHQDPMLGGRLPIVASLERRFPGYGRLGLLLALGAVVIVPLTIVVLSLFSDDSWESDLVASDEEPARIFEPEPVPELVSPSTIDDNGEPPTARDALAVDLGDSSEPTDSPEPSQQPSDTTIDATATTDASVTTDATVATDTPASTSTPSTTPTPEPPSAVVETIATTDYRKNIAGTKTGVIWTSDRVALFIEGDTSADDRDRDAMAKILGWMDQMFAIYERVTGTSPANPGGYDGKIRVEASTEVGGGLASHDVMGIAVGFGFFESTHDRVVAGENSFDQIYYYEAARNFWTRDLNPRIDYHTSKGPEDYGWWTVGFNNAMACFLTKEMNIGLHYHGQNWENFCIDNMLTKHNTYISDPSYTWENTWNVPLLPWRENTSLNDLMSGTLIHMYLQDYGGIDFISRLYKEIRLRPELESRSDYQGARDNFYVASSIAAQRDLADYFGNTLKWPLSDEAKAEVANRT